MSLRRLMSQPLTVQHNTFSADDYNNDVPGTATTTDLLGYLEQTASTERVNDRETVTVERQCWIPAGTVITALDRVVYGNQTFQVVGSPAIMWNPRTRKESHIVCRLVTVTGG